MTVTSTLTSMTTFESLTVATLFVSLVVALLRILPVPHGDPESESLIRSLRLEIAERDKTVAAKQATIDHFDELYRRLLEEQSYLTHQVRQLSATKTELEKRLTTMQADPTRSFAAPFQVLGIWPLPDYQLNTQAEEVALYNSGFAYRSLRGSEATKEGIARELRRNAHYRVVEVGSHGDASGIQLADEVARPGWWLRLVQEYPHLRLFLLLACESDDVADALVRARVPAVVSVQRKIPDADAVKFVRNFYDQLGELLGDSQTVGDVAEVVEFARHLLPEASASMVRFRSAWPANEVLFSLGEG